VAVSGGAPSACAWCEAPPGATPGPAPPPPAGLAARLGRGGVVLAGCAGLAVAAASTGSAVAWWASGPRPGPVAVAGFPPGTAASAPPSAPAAPAPDAGGGGAAAVAARLDGLEEGHRVAALLLATITLEDAAAGSAPFAGELAYAMRAVPAPDAAGLLAPLDRLMRWAEAGVPSRAELAVRFPRAMAEARAARAGAASLADRATLAMRDTALRVGIGELPPGDPDAALERAGTSLAAGRLEAALADLGRAAAPAAPPPALAAWTRDAAARAETDAALRELRRLVLARALR
jgi:hypothetical protein